MGAVDSLVAVVGRASLKEDTDSEVVGRILGLEEDLYMLSVQLLRMRYTRWSKSARIRRLTALLGRWIATWRLVVVAHSVEYSV